MGRASRRARRAEGTVGSWVRLALAAAVWSLLTVVGLSAAGMLLSGASYAGASDERVESFAANTYATFLRGVAFALAKLALAEWVFITFVTLGLAHLVIWLRRSGRTSAARHQAAIALTSLFATLTLLGFGAAVHPGLFLGLLASSRVAAVWAAICWYLGPAVLVVSILGHFLGAARGRRPMQIAFVGLAALAGALAGRVRGMERRYQPKVFAVVDAPAKAKPASSRGPNGSASGASGVSGVSGVPNWTTPDDELVGSKRPRILPARPSNVLWLAVDSLRPDHIDPKNTPNIAALIEGSIYFPNTIAPVPRTGPSWASTLTGLEPLTTGIETMFPDAKRSDLATLALPAYLVDRGYRTMVASEYAGEFFRRIKVGFDVEAVPRAELKQISGQIMLGRAPIVLAEAGLLYGASPAARSLVPSPLDELIRGMPNFSCPRTLGEDVRAFLKTPSTDPAFVLMFYSQPHFPYTSSPKWARRYHVPGSDPALAFGRDVASEKPISTDADRRQVDGLYRAALAESDAAIGELMGHLAATGFLDDTIVVLTADHGEGLYECPECVGHGDNLRGMMTLRVPLAIKLPRGRFPEAQPSVETATASLLDVYPTLVELLGLEAIAIHEGMSLLDSHGKKKALPPRSLVVETGEWLWTTAAVPKDRIDYPPITELATIDGDRIAIDPKYEGVIRAAKHRAVIRAPYKLVYEPSRSGVRYRLFDYEADPLDTNDLAASKPDVLADLRGVLRRSMLRHAKVLPVGDYFLTKPAGIPEGHW
ncbi:MAG: sulfatase-like hydrolase/transferase [Deltaproteobacteria bacterium]|nr:sulfatase-like hydrolase/transferase [Deltaproteobacteria bacterium]